MKPNDQLNGKTAKLPDGQKVRIETVHDDGYASVRRIDGPYAGSIAVCLISKLELANKVRGTPEQASV